MTAKASDEGPWSEMVRTPEGVPEVSAAWVHAHGAATRLVDVRERDELVGPLGHIEGIEHVPLAEVERVAAGWDREQPVVLVCRSGARSGRAALALERLGFRRVASLAGGMVAWQDLGLPRG